MRKSALRRGRKVSEEGQAMSIFGSIVSAIFGSAKGAAPAATAATAATTAAAGGGTVVGGGAPPAATSGAAPAAAKPMSRADVEAMIQKIADSSGRKEYKWKQSIVDLMKLLDLDSSLNARKELATELGYTGALNGSAEMNTWLHKQVMTKLMESGGVVPDSLK